MAEKTSIFSFSCDTCAARLTVRDESAIGQVLSCPKCGSMVQVTAPDGWIPSVVELPPRRPRDPNDSQATLSGEFSNLNVGKTAARSGSKRTPISRPATGPGETRGEAPVLPDQTWQSESSRARSKKIAWMAGIVGVCLIALVAVISLVTSLAGGRESVSENDPVVESRPAADDPQAGINSVSPDDNSPDDNSPDDNSPDDNSPDDNSPDDNSPDDNSPDDNSPESEPNPAKDADPADTPQPGSGTDNPINADKSQSNPGNGSDDASDTGEPAPDQPNADETPLIDVANSLVGEADGISIDDTATDKSMMDDVGELNDLFTDTHVDLEALRDIAGDSSESLIGIGKVFVPFPKPLELDFSRQIDEKFPGISFQDVPLVEFLGRLNVLTGIPIVLDSHSVLYGHLDPVAKVSFRGTDKSVLEVINEATSEMNLVAIAVPEQAWIVLTDNNQQVFSSRTIELDERLVGDDEQNTQLINLIHVITGPDLWNSNGGLARIEISGKQALVESDGRLGDEVAWLLDRLNAMSRLTAGQDARPELKKLRSLWSATRETLESADAFEQNQLEPVYQILKQVYQNDGLIVLVDWPSIASLRWNPSLQMPWPSRELTVAETLRDITSSMGLSSRILAPGVVEITSREQYWDASRIEVFPCREQLIKFTPEQIMAYLKSNIAADLREGSWKRVEFDPRLQCIVARLPDPLLIRVEKTLDELAR